MHTLKPHPRPTESQTLGMGSRNLWFHKPFRWFSYTLKFENPSPWFYCGHGLGLSPTSSQSLAHVGRVNSEMLTHANKPHKVPTKETHLNDLQSKPEMVRKTKNSCHSNQHILSLWAILWETKLSERNGEHFLVPCFWIVNLNILYFGTNWSLSKFTVIKYQETEETIFIWSRPALSDRNTMQATYVM